MSALEFFFVVILVLLLGLAAYLMLRISEAYRTLRSLRRKIKKMETSGE